MERGAGWSVVWVSAPTAVTTSADLNRLACGGCHGPSDSFCEAPVVALLSRDRRKASSSGAGPSPASAQSLLPTALQGKPLHKSTAVANAATPE